MNEPVRHSAITQESPVPLAPPGAGLPPVERFFARIIMRWKAGRVSRQAATERFAMERDAILRIVADADPEVLPMPVLIKRLPGLEDSSRYWSVLMTLDHLGIVNGAIGGAILALADGKVPPVEASTAAVKPDRAVGPEVIGAFEAGCSQFEQVIDSVADLRTSAKYSHPWFGPLDAASWHFMAGFHMGLHRRQLERILTGLRTGAGEF